MVSVNDSVGAGGPWRRDGGGSELEFSAMEQTLRMGARKVQIASERPSSCRRVD